MLASVRTRVNLTEGCCSLPFSTVVHGGSGSGGGGGDTENECAWVNSIFLKPYPQRSYYTAKKYLLEILLAGARKSMGTGVTKSPENGNCWYIAAYQRTKLGVISTAGRYTALPTPES